MVALLVFLFLLPLIYVLALGPLIWIHDRGMMADPVEDIVEVAYWPLERVSRTSPLLAEPLDWYVSLWQSRTAVPAAASAMPAPNLTPMPAPGGS